jgi:hypothetical protein
MTTIASRIGAVLIWNTRACDILAKVAKRAAQVDKLQSVRRTTRTRFVLPQSMNCSTNSSPRPTAA